MPALEILNQPGKIGNLIIPNRFVMSPMTRCYSPKGIPSEKAADYYRRRAEGNVGLIITGIRIKWLMIPSDPPKP
mgnify:CR=1 FL=1